MAYKPTADRGRIVTFTIAGTDTVVKPIKIVNRYPEEGSRKYNVISAVNMDTKEIPFVGLDGIPVAFKILTRQEKIVGK